MGLGQTVRRIGDAEIAIFCISSQAIGDKILVAIMADGDALFRTRPLCGGRRAPLGLEFLSRGGFGGGLAGNGLARGRFFLRGNAPRCPRGRLLLGHRRSPFPVWENVSTDRASQGGLREASPPFLRRRASAGRAARSARM